MNTQQSFLDYFQCPSGLANFRLLGELAERRGFFQFGPDVTCYGRTSSARVADAPGAHLQDALAGVRIEDKVCYLPFSLDEIVNNLRFERYQTAANGRKFLANSLVRNAYYAIRPFLPVALRKHLQRRALRTWDQSPFPRWPVDKSVDLFFDRMMLLALRAAESDRVPFIWFWPDGCSGAVIMTHDVETRTGLDFCPSLMDLDDSFGMKSSFQLVPEERYSVPDEMLRSIRKRGFEVNVHDLNHDGNLFRKREEFLRRAQLINKYGRKFEAVGYRSGVLYRNLDWYDAFHFSYDMSVPNVGHLDPQSGGCCTTKPYFVGKILEIPVTTTQDYTLFHILGQFSIDLWEQQIDLILKQNGLVSFIVHPDYVIENKMRETYRALLKHLSEIRFTRNAWFALPSAVDRWWRDRSQMQLLQGPNGKWRIEGAGKERARLAYARCSGDRVSYSIEASYQETL
jgi:hypothetical protein